MRFVTVVNRLSPPKDLQGTWDGKHFLLPPGRTQLDEQRARAVKLQNPIKGSDDPTTGNLQYYVGVEEEGDDCSPVEFSKDIELFNSLRSKAVPIMIIPGKVGMYNEQDRPPALPLDSNFVAP